MGKIQFTQAQGSHLLGKGFRRHEVFILSWSLRVFHSEPVYKDWKEWLFFFFFVMCKSVHLPTKITRHRKKQENMTLSKYQNISPETDPENTQPAELADKHFKTYFKYEQGVKKYQENNIWTKKSSKRETSRKEKTKFWSWKIQ